MAITLSTAVGTVTLKEGWKGYRRGRSASEGRILVKEYILAQADWNKIDAVIDALMGGSTVSGSGSTATITRKLPHQAPEDARLYCNDAWFMDGAEVESRDGGRPTFANASIQAVYGYMPFNVNPIDAIPGFDNSDDPASPYTFAIQDVEGGSEVVRQPASSMKFQSDNKPAVEGTPRFIGTSKLFFSKKNVKVLRYSLYSGLQNKLNDRIMFGNAVGTLRFHTWHTRSEFNDDGSVAKEIRLEFWWREIDWNKVTRPDSAAYDTLIDVATGAKMYTYADLRPLLTS